jgi:hypothetical protein
MRIHHIATNKGAIGWADEFDRMFKSAGLDLDDDINKVLLKSEYHRSPHGNPYHAWVHAELVAATEEATGGLSRGSTAFTDAYRGALLARLSEIKDYLADNQEMVTTKWWNE